MRSNNRSCIDGLNINQLIILATGKSADPMQPSPVGDFLAVTTWKPSNQAILGALSFRGFMSKAANHSMVAVEKIYKLHCEITSTNQEDDFYHQNDIVPFLWGAGLLSHPEILQKTKWFVQAHYLTKNVHLCKYYEKSPNNTFYRPV